MYDETTFKTRAAEIIRAGRFFFERGWVPATAGNFSARLDTDHMAITVSGRHKGELDEDGIMAIDLEGNVLTKDKRPSAETFLHIILYRRDPTLGSVLHTHSVNATLLSILTRREGRNELMLSDYEVLKALPGIDTHASSVRVPVFANDQDIPRLAAQVDDYMQKHRDVHGYLIEGHGFYTWGADVAAARRHIEAFEFLFECEMQLRRLGS
jgi:methylthioribulose-1-phosphate dehydratase